MSSATFHQLDRTARDLAPAAISFMIVLVAALPYHIPQFGPIAPNVGIMAVYFWCANRPDRFSVVSAFCLGFWQDVLVGTPLGVNAFVFLAAYGLINQQRRFVTGSTFADFWIMFGVVALGAAALTWLLIMILHSALVSPLPGVFQLFLTALTFPFVSWFLGWVQRIVLREA